MARCVERVALPTSEHESGQAERARVGVAQSRDVLVVARAVGEHPPLHGGNEPRPVLAEDPLPVGRVRLDRLGPLLQVRHGLHAAGPGLAERPAAVVRGQGQQTEDAAADPPDGQALGHLAMPRRSEQRHAGAPGAARDHGRRQLQVTEQRSQRVGLHGRLGAPLEAHVRLAAVGPVPYHDAVPGIRQSLRQLAYPGRILGETPTRGDRPGSPHLADQLVGQRERADPGHLDLRHRHDLVLLQTRSAG